MRFFKKNSIFPAMALIILVSAVFGCTHLPPNVVKIDDIVSRGAASSEMVTSGIVLNDLQGVPVNLSLINQPTILFFWTTWCPYCRKEIKALNQIYPQLKKEGIAVFAINIKEAGYKVQRFFQDYQLNFRVLLDKDAKAADSYDLLGVPTYILLNKANEQVAQENRLPADYKNLLFK